MEREKLNPAETVVDIFPASVLGTYIFSLGGDGISPVKKKNCMQSGVYFRLSVAAKRINGNCGQDGFCTYSASVLVAPVPGLEGLSGNCSCPN